MTTLRTLLLFIGLALAGPAAQAASREEIDAEVREAIGKFHTHTSAGRELAEKAAGMLVFPNVIKAGIGIGGEYGEGALLVDGKSVAYYNIASASIGFQLGAQARSQIVLFMTRDALAKFTPATAGRPASTAASRWPRWARAAQSTARPPRSRSSASSSPTRA